MITLSDYRASIRRLIEAENIEDAFEAEGYGERAATLTSESNAFRASRSTHVYMRQLSKSSK